MIQFKKMKKIIFGCLIIYLTVASIVQPEDLQGQGYLVGDFENFDMRGSKEYRITGNEIPGWYTDKGEVGYGSTYNKNWEATTKVIELDSFAFNAHYYAQYILPVAAKYMILFDYAARQNVTLETSKFIVSINGVQQEITPENYNVNTYYERFIGIKGLNTFELFGAGPADHYGVTVDNVRLILFNYVPYDNFEDFNMGEEKEWKITSDIPGWQVIDGEVGYSTLYNPQWNNHPFVTKVIDLDAYGYNANYKTQFELPKAGRYAVLVLYAAKQGAPLETCKFILKVNGQSFEEQQPADYKVNVYEAEFDGVQGMNNLNLIGAGPADHFGVTVGHVLVLTVT